MTRDASLTCIAVRRGDAHDGGSHRCILPHRDVVTTRVERRRVIVVVDDVDVDGDVDGLRREAAVVDGGRQHVQRRLRKVACLRYFYELHSSRL